MDAIMSIVGRWVIDQAKAALDKAGIKSESQLRLLQELFLALARWAQAEIPAEGMGEKRLDLLLNLAKGLPFVGPVLAKREAWLRAGLQAVVAAFKGELKALAESPRPLLLPGPDEPKP